MTVFRRIEEASERQDFSGEYTTYDAFFYQGPFTDYPYWAQYAFVNGSMVVRNSVALLIDRVERKYPEDARHEATWPVAVGSWVMRIYHHVSKDNYTVTLRECTTEEMRVEFFPSGELEMDEDAEFFNVNTLTEGHVTLPMPTRFMAFQWKGVSHEIPAWLSCAIREGGVVLRGASLYHMCQVARPGDWVLYSHNKPIKMITDAEYRAAGGK